MILKACPQKIQLTFSIAIFFSTPRKLSAELIIIKRRIFAAWSSAFFSLYIFMQSISEISNYDEAVGRNSVLLLSMWFNKIYHRPGRMCIHFCGEHPLTGWTLKLTFIKKYAMKSPIPSRCWLFCCIFTMMPLIFWSIRNSDPKNSYHITLKTNAHAHSLSLTRKLFGTASLSFHTQ